MKQNLIQNPVKHLWGRFFAETVKSIFSKTSILNDWLGFEYIFVFL